MGGSVAWGFVAQVKRGCLHRQRVGNGHCNDYGDEVGMRRGNNLTRTIVGPVG